MTVRADLMAHAWLEDQIKALTPCRALLKIFETGQNEDLIVGDLPGRLLPVGHHRAQETHRAGRGKCKTSQHIGPIISVRAHRQACAWPSHPAHIQPPSHPRDQHGIHNVVMPQKVLAHK